MSIGYTAQLLFSARLIIQWVASEKAKKSKSPVLYWIFSLMASLLLILYGKFRNDIAIIAGQSLSYIAYIINLYLKNVIQKLAFPIKILIFLLPLLIWLSLFFSKNYGLASAFENNSTFWTIWGTLGMLILTFRFLYQAIYSIRVKESVLPLLFWIFSIIGSSMVIVYSIKRKDPVLFIGQIFVIFVYIRNVMFYLKKNE